ncbi:hypothetical protein A7X94_17630 [Stenotrophomonas maltophilia]|nr:hypothetical protein VL21_10430 [Stenotrophomonas maltophilia]KUO97679.1 hypothetical protein AR276_24090 [Stenotrophomonas maltophilia]PZT31498.1 hypothetical protein A7X94_17630 [Stenotrophomonas maltophilia]
MRSEISQRISAQIEYVIPGVISRPFECGDQIRTQWFYPTVARRNQPSTRSIYYTPSSIGLGQQQLVIQSFRGLKRRKSVVQGRRDAAIFQHHETHPRFAGLLILDDPAVQRMQACSALQGAQRPIQAYNVFIIFRTEDYIPHSFSELICLHTVACRRRKHQTRAREMQALAVFGYRRKQVPTPTKLEPISTHGRHLHPVGIQHRVVPALGGERETRTVEGHLIVVLAPYACQ